MINRKHAYWIIPLLAVAIYANTIGHGFVYDDILLISGNKYTTRGTDGIPQLWDNDSFEGHFGHGGVVEGGRYRPLTPIMFALEWELAPASPLPGHLVNVLLYALCSLMVYLALLALFPKAKTWWASVPFLSAVLFALHPVHTEAVANIKSRDEIMAMLMSLLSLWLVLRYTDRKQIAFLICASLSFLLALFAKENALNFLIIIPMTLWFFRHPTPRQYGLVMGSLIVPVTFFLIKRYQVLGGLAFEPSADLLNNPFAGMGTGEKMAGILYVLLMYIKLMIAPWPLTSDYYPWHIPRTDMGQPIVWLSLIILTGLAAGTIRGILKRKALAWALLFYAISLAMVSNIFFTIGVFMAERFLFMPSLGFIVFLVLILKQAYSKLPLNKSLRQIIAICFSIMLMLSFAGMSISRNADWKDNFTLFTRDVHVSGESIKANAAAGAEWMKRAIETEGKESRKAHALKAVNYLRKAIGLYPRYQKALTDLGTAHFFAGSPPDSVLHYYHASLDLHRLDMQVYKNIARFVPHFTDMPPRRKAEILASFNQRYGGVYEINYLLGKIYGRQLQDIDQAIACLERASGIRPGAVEAWADLGTAYAIKGQKDKALGAWEKALQLAPQDKSIRANIEQLKREGIGQ